MMPLAAAALLAVPIIQRVGRPVAPLGGYRRRLRWRVLHGGWGCGGVSTGTAVAAGVAGLAVGATVGSAAAQPTYVVAPPRPIRSAAAGCSGARRPSAAFITACRTARPGLRQLAAAPRSREPRSPAPRPRWAGWRAPLPSRPPPPPRGPPRRQPPPCPCSPPRNPSHHASRRRPSRLRIADVSPASCPAIRNPSLGSTRAQPPMPQRI